MENIPRNYKKVTLQLLHDLLIMTPPNCRGDRSHLYTVSLVYQRIIDDSTLANRDWCNPLDPYNHGIKTITGTTAVIDTAHLAKDGLLVCMVSSVTAVCVVDAPREQMSSVISDNALRIRQAIVQDLQPIAVKISQSNTEWRRLGNGLWNFSRGPVEKVPLPGELIPIDWLKICT